MQRYRYSKITNEKQLAAAGVTFPATITFEGQDYYGTGKLGTHIATCRPTKEYQCSVNADRLWAFSDGTIAEAHS
jgi:hypothetical protein